MVWQGSKIQTSVYVYLHKCWWLVREACLSPQSCYTGVDWNPRFFLFRLATNVNIDGSAIFEALADIQKEREKKKKGRGGM